MRLNLALELFAENIPEIISAMVSNVSDDMQALAEEQQVLGKGWIADHVRKLTIEHRFGDQLRRIKRLQGYERAKNHPYTTSGINDTMVQAAKEYPIQDLYTGKLHKAGRLLCGKCPFHSEKTASFYIKENKYKCYGCGVWGDSIDFYKRLNNVDFIRAVKALQ